MVKMNYIHCFILSLVESKFSYRFYKNPQHEAGGGEGIKPTVITHQTILQTCNDYYRYTCGNEMEGELAVSVDIH